MYRALLTVEVRSQGHTVQLRAGELHALEHVSETGRLWLLTNKYVEPAEGAVADPEAPELRVRPVVRRKSSS